jgi:hypothetical protein
MRRKCGLCAHWMTTPPIERSSESTLHEVFQDALEVWTVCTFDGTVVPQHFLPTQIVCNAIA